MYIFNELKMYTQIGIETFWHAHTYEQIYTDTRTFKHTHGYVSVCVYVYNHNNIVSTNTLLSSTIK